MWSHVTIALWLLLANALVNADFFYPTEDELLYSSHRGFGRRLVSRPGRKSAFQCPGEGFFADPNDCQLFYRCVNYGNGNAHTAFEFKCSEGTVFDESIIACNHPWAVSGPCGANQISLGEIESEHPSGPATGGGPPPSSAQEPEPEPVPEPEASTDDETNEIEGASTGEGSDSRPNCKEDGFFVDPNDCRKFYRCVSTDNKGSFDVFRFSCGPGSVFDDEKKVCSHPRDVKGNCGVTEAANEADTSDASQQNGSSESTTAGSSVSESSSVSSLDNESNSNSGTSSESSTAGSGSSESTTSSTENSSSSSSSESSSETSSSSENTSSSPDKGSGETDGAQSPEDSGSTESTSGNTNDCNKPAYKGDCEEEGFFPVAGDCKKFYRCVSNGKPGSFSKYDFECGEGTVFDPDNNVCNHASTVQRDCDNPESASQTMNPENGTHTESGKPAESGEGSSESPSEQQESSSEPASESSSESSVDPTNEQSESSSEPTNQGTSENSNEPTSESTTATSSESSSEQSSGPPETTSESGNESGAESSSEQTSVESSSEHSSVSSTESGQSEASETTTGSTSSETPPDNSSSSESSPTDGESNETSNEGKDQCTSEGFHPSNGDCKKFYRCVDNGKGGFDKYDFVCGDGTVFDPKHNVCNHERDVDRDCGAPASEEQGSSSETPPENLENGSSTSEQSQTSSSATSESSTQSGESSTEGSQQGSGSSTAESSNIGGSSTEGSQQGGESSTEGSQQGGESSTEGSQQGGESSTEGSQQGGESSTEGSQQGGDSSTEGGEKQPGDPSSTESSSSSQSPESGSQTTESSNSGECTSEGFFPHPSDCKKFFRCVDNGKGGLTKYDFDCAEGTVFDPEINVCNHERDVQRDCSASVATTTAPEEETTTDAATTPPSDGEMATTTASSPDNEAPGIDSTTTQNPETDPDEPTPPVSPPCIHIDPNPPVVNCTMDGYYPDPTNCSNFYRCIGFDEEGDKFNVYFFRCPNGKHYDPKRNVCDKPENIQPPRECEQPSEETTTSGPTTQQPEETTTSATPVETTTSPGETAAPTTQETTTAPAETTTAPSETVATTPGETGPPDELTTTAAPGTTAAQPETTTTPPEEQQQTTTTAQPETTTHVPPDQTTTPPPSEEQTTQPPEAETTSPSGTTTAQPEAETTTVQPESTKEPGPVETTPTPEEGSTTQPPDSQTEPPTITESPVDNTTTSTEMPGESCDCCNLDEGQYAYVCPTGFRRHPKYCNRFYQCTEKDQNDLSVLTLSCPEGLVFDTEMQKCLEQEMAAPCNGEIAQETPPESRSRNYKSAVMVGGKDLCPNTGFYQYEPDCHHFIHCREDARGNLRGQFKRCPDGFTFWEVSRRCEVARRIAKSCSGRSANVMAWNVPVDYNNVGRLSRQLLRML